MTAPEKKSREQMIAGALAILMHVLLILALIFGVSWQRQTVEQVAVVELWNQTTAPVAEAPAAETEPTAPPPPPPKASKRLPPPPKVTPSSPPPAPPVKADLAKAKADIALKDKREQERQKKAREDERLKEKEREKEKDKQKQRDKEKDKEKEREKEREKARDKDREKEKTKARELEQQKADARDKAKRDQEKAQERAREVEFEKKKQAEQEQVKQRQAAETRLQAEQERMRANEAQQQAAGRQREIEKYSDGIRARVHAKVILPPGVAPNLQVEVNVKLLPGGDLLDVRILKGSGNAAYDAAVERAVRAATPFAVPSGELFHQKFRSFEMVFKPMQ